MRIGTYRTGNAILADFWSGVIDEVDVFNRALTSAEIQAIFSAGSAGKCVGGSNQSPVANPGGPYAGAEGSAISFNGTASIDLDGDALTYAWDFESDGVVDAMTATASQIYRDNGSYTAKLTVDDGNGGTNSQTVAVTVTNVAPSLEPLSVPYTPIALQTSGTPVMISAAFTDRGTLDTQTGVLSCDGGTAGLVTAIATGGSGTANGTCTFTASGVYTVSMT